LDYFKLPEVDRTHKEMKGGFKGSSDRITVEVMRFDPVEGILVQINQYIQKPEVQITAAIG